MGTQEVPAVVMAEARGWLLDIDINPRKRNAGKVRAAINRHYAGGWNQFLADTAGL